MRGNRSRWWRRTALLALARAGRAPVWALFASSVHAMHRPDRALRFAGGQRSWSCTRCDPGHSMGGQRSWSCTRCDPAGPMGGQRSWSCTRCDPAGSDGRAAVVVVHTVRSGGFDGHRAWRPARARTRAAAHRACAAGTCPHPAARPPLRPLPGALDQMGGRPPLALDQVVERTSRGCARCSPRVGTARRCASARATRRASRIRRTGRLSERRTVNSSSAWVIGQRRSFSACWMSSGVPDPVGVGDRAVPPIQLGVLPRVGAVLVLAEERPADVAAEHLARSCRRRPGRLTAAANRSVWPTIQAVR